MNGNKTANKAALVLGATGGIGGEVARTLLARGWTVRALARASSSSAQRLNIDGVDWIEGDAMHRDDVVRAAQGADLIVHAVNPPGYRNWALLVLPMIDNSIAAAQAHGARILVPGTVYNYGSGSAQPLTERSPQKPSSRKGAIRVEMERRLQASGVRVLIVRAGDFFGPRAGNNWFSQGLVKAGKPVRTVAYPGAAGVGHAWAYLPDLADTMVRLAEQEPRLASFETFHFRGHWDADGSAMAQTVAATVRATGGTVAIKGFPWLALRLLAPFVTTFSEMFEMRYLWREGFALDNAKLLALLGHETHTPLAEAVARTLDGLGCLQREVRYAAA
jgi:nucleoside-diphosphate-sugar epimerase